MKNQILLFAGLVFLSANIVAAQTRTVTNADLEKFRQNRVQSERDYRENYQRLGLPSPEELEKRREQNRLELAELSTRLQNESLAREQRQRENDFRQSQNGFSRGFQSSQGAYYGNGYYSTGLYGAYPYYGLTPFGYSYGYNNNFSGGRFGYNRGFKGGRNFYNPASIFQAHTFGTGRGGVRISVTGGTTRTPVSIGSPR